MSTLVGYGSSDEEEDETIGQLVEAKQQAVQAENAASKPSVSAATGDGTQNASPSVGVPPATAATKTSQFTDSTSGPMPQDTASIEAPIGPSLGPARAPGPYAAPDASEPTASPSNNSTRPPSPRSAYRSAMQSLTLPRVPNFSIPASPPGSPTQTGAVDAKIAQFRALKNQGVHFNEKLAASSALKNPSLLGKLIANAGLDEADQYANTLPGEVWDVSRFPEWAYKEELEAARLRAEKAREEVKRGRMEVEFVKGEQKEGRKSRFDR